MGRMGNFLFQAATAYAYAKKHNLEFTVPSRTKDAFWNPLYLQHLVKPLPPLRAYDIVEKQHEYKPLPFFHNWAAHNIVLEGYFQSEKYFKEYREDILKAFAFSWNPHNNVSIHVRRGDYLKYPHKHPVVPDEFYEQAMIHFIKKGFTDFHVFSDDIHWCKKYFGEWKYKASENVSLNFAYHEGGTPEEDLIGISNCAGGHINSSSTFAWWGAWLNQNPNKIVITPKLWFVPGHGNLNTNDIIPESWIKI